MSRAVSFLVIPMMPSETLQMQLTHSVPYSGIWFYRLLFILTTSCLLRTYFWCTISQLVHVSEIDSAPLSIKITYTPSMHMVALRERSKCSLKFPSLIARVKFWSTSTISIIITPKGEIWIACTLLSNCSMRFFNGELAAMKASTVSNFTSLYPGRDYIWYDCNFCIDVQMWV